jgi:NAD(P)-dependent dehydrogenase (short-subunit alcohol dehydrogenase family)
MPTALITGAGSGIGRETTLHLARCGYALALTARGGERLEAVADEAAQQGAGDLLIRSTDVGRPADAEALVDAVLEAFGRLDVIVNNAGMAPSIPVGKYDIESIERCFAVNAIGPAVIINRAWPALVRQGGGRIVNVSTLGTRDPFPGFFAYAAAKCALNSFTRSIVNEGREHGILAFTIAPGVVETPLLRSIFDESQVPREMTLEPEAVAEVIVQCATGQRDGEAGEVIWLARDL